MTLYKVQGTKINNCPTALKGLNCEDPAAAIGNATRLPFYLIYFTTRFAQEYELFQFVRGIFH
jgi:hypothetical protein